MCWSHVFRAITPQLKPLSSLNKELAKNLLSDIEEIQWSAVGMKVLTSAHPTIKESKGKIETSKLPTHSDQKHLSDHLLTRCSEWYMNGA